MKRLLNKKELWNSIFSLIVAGVFILVAVGSDFHLSTTEHLGNGVYKENLIINKTIALIGSDWDSTYIDGRGMAAHSIQFNSSGSIENFTLYGSDGLKHFPVNE